jgi:hypothetical protein
MADLNSPGPLERPGLEPKKPFLPTTPQPANVSPNAPIEDSNVVEYVKEHIPPEHLRPDRPARQPAQPTPLIKRGLGGAISAGKGMVNLGVNAVSWMFGAAKSMVITSLVDPGEGLREAQILAMKNLSDGSQTMPNMTEELANFVYALILAKVEEQRKTNNSSLMNAAVHELTANSQAIKNGINSLIMKSLWDISEQDEEIRRRHVDRDEECVNLAPEVFLDKVEAVLIKRVAPFLNQIEFLQGNDDIPQIEKIEKAKQIYKHMADALLTLVFQEKGNEWDIPIVLKLVMSGIGGVGISYAGDTYNIIRDMMADKFYEVHKTYMFLREQDDSYLERLPGSKDVLGMLQGAIMGGIKGLASKKNEETHQDQPLVNLDGLSPRSNQLLDGMAKRFIANDRMNREEKVTIDQVWTFVGNYLDLGLKRLGKDIFGGAEGKAPFDHFYAMLHQALEIGLKEMPGLVDLTEKINHGSMAEVTEIMKGLIAGQDFNPALVQAWKNVQDIQDPTKQLKEARKLARTAIFEAATSAALQPILKPEHLRKILPASVPTSLVWGIIVSVAGGILEDLTTKAASVIKESKKDEAELAKVEGGRELLDQAANAVKSFLEGTAANPEAHFVKDNPLIDQIIKTLVQLGKDPKSKQVESAVVGVINDYVKGALAMLLAHIAAPKPGEKESHAPHLMKNILEKVSGAYADCDAFNQLKGVKARVEQLEKLAKAQPDLKFNVAAVVEAPNVATFAELIPETRERTSSKIEVKSIDQALKEIELISDDDQKVEALNRLYRKVTVLLASREVLQAIAPLGLLKRILPNLVNAEDLTNTLTGVIESNLNQLADHLAALEVHYDNALRNLQNSETALVLIDSACKAVNDFIANGAKSDATFVSENPLLEGVVKGLIKDAQNRQENPAAAQTVDLIQNSVRHVITIITASLLAPDKDNPSAEAKAVALTQAINQTLVDAFRAANEAGPIEAKVIFNRAAKELIKLVLKDQVVRQLLPPAFKEMDVGGMVVPFIEKALVDLYSTYGLTVAQAEENTAILKSIDNQLPIIVGKLAGAATAPIAQIAKQETILGDPIVDSAIKEFLKADKADEAGKHAAVDKFVNAFVTIVVNNVGDKHPHMLFDKDLPIKMVAGVFKAYNRGADGVLTDIPEDLRYNKQLFAEVMTQRILTYFFPAGQAGLPFPQEYQNKIWALLSTKIQNAIATNLETFGNRDKRMHFALDRVDNWVNGLQAEVNGKKTEVHPETKAAREKLAGEPLKKELKHQLRKGFSLQFKSSVNKLFNRLFGDTPILFQAVMRVIALPLVIVANIVWYTLTNYFTRSLVDILDKVNMDEVIMAEIAELLKQLEQHQETEDAQADLRNEMKHFLEKTHLLPGLFNGIAASQGSALLANMLGNQTLLELAASYL